MDNKEQIINEYLIGGISFRSLAKKYGVSRSTINRWVTRPEKTLHFKKLILVLLYSGIS
jgi:transposase